MRERRPQPLLRTQERINRRARCPAREDNERAKPRGGSWPGGSPEDALWAAEGLGRPLGTRRGTLPGPPKLACAPALRPGSFQTGQF